MTASGGSAATSKWTGLVPVDDTALAVTDTGGPGRPKVASNHGAILRKAFRAVAEAIREVAALDRAGR